MTAQAIAKKVEQSLLGLSVLVGYNDPILQRSPSWSKHRGLKAIDVNPDAMIDLVFEGSYLKDKGPDLIWIERAEKLVEVLTGVYSSLIVADGYLSVSISSLLKYEDLLSTAHREDLSAKALEDLRDMLLSLPRAAGSFRRPEFSPDAARTYGFIVFRIKDQISRLALRRGRVLEFLSRLEDSAAKYVISYLYEESPYREHLKENGLTNFLIESNADRSEIAKYCSSEKKASLLAMDLGL